MKTHTVTTYSATELKEQFPDAFERALERYRRDSDEIHWQSEIFDSLKATVEAAGLTLRDWNLGLCNRSNGIKIAFPGSYDEETAELSGPRAMAWLENNLFGPLRIGWTTKARRELRRYGSDYYAGKVKPCPLTGVCFDDDYLNALRVAIVRDKDTLAEAFAGLANTYVSLLQTEYENQMSEEYFIEAHGDDCFTADGERF